MNSRGSRITASLFLVLLLAAAGCGSSTETSPTTLIPASPTAEPIVPTVAPTLDAAASAQSANRAIPVTNTPLTGDILADSLSPTPTGGPLVPSSAASPTPTVQLEVSCSEEGQVLTGVFSGSVAGRDRAYRVYLPPCYSADGRTYPTLYLFHGGAHADDHWDYLGADEAAEKLIQEKQLPPFIIVMPDGGDLDNNTSGGPASFEGMFLEELLPFIESSYCSWQDPAGRAMGGISRGGYWALEIAFRHPDVIGSVGGHSAALLDTHAGPEVNPQDTALANDLDGLRIYLDIGQNDYVINQVRQLHEDMEEVGVRHTWILNEGQHEDAYWSEHLEEYLLWYGQNWPPDRSAYPLCSVVPGEVEN